MKLSSLADSIVLEVSDNGKSFPLERILQSNIKDRLGVLGMRERVEMVDGIFSIESSPGQGTTVRAVIPIGDKLASNSLSTCTKTP